MPRRSWFWDPKPRKGERIADAKRWLRAQAKEGVAASPVTLDGHAIARTFWGKSWCKNLESYADFSNRLPRGRSYVRSGSVVHLALEPGLVSAKVKGSKLYATTVRVAPLEPARWSELVARHSSAVASLVDLLQGRLPAALLHELADRSSGLFPSPKEMRFDCSCPDGAAMCKHVAAALYGVGARLDAQPELFFVLRGVEVTDLVVSGSAFEGGASEIASEELGEIFGIELALDEPPPLEEKATARKRRSTRRR